MLSDETKNYPKGITLAFKCIFCNDWRYIDLSLQTNQVLPGKKLSALAELGREVALESAPCHVEMAIH